jgi:hypothetical protein
MVIASWTLAPVLQDVQAASQTGFYRLITQNWGCGGQGESPVCELHSRLFD